MFWVLKSTISMGTHNILFLAEKFLTLKAPITTAADDKFWNIFPNFQQK